MFQNGIGRQEHRLHIGEVTVHERHAELGLIVAVLAQPLHNDGGVDLAAVVGDQAVGPCDHIIRHARVGQRVFDDVHAFGFGEQRLLHGIHRDHHMHFVEQAAATRDYIDMAVRHRAERAGAYSDCHISTA